MADDALVHERFLEEGVRRYGKACAIIDVFRDTFSQRLERILNERKSWGSFVPATGREGAPKTRTHHAQKYIETMRRGRFCDVEVLLMIAAWWEPGIDNPPEEGVILYSQFRDAAQKKDLPLDLDLATLPSRVRPSYHPPLMLYLVPDDPLDLEGEYALLLDHLLACKLA